MEGPAFFTAQGRPTAYQRTGLSLCTAPHILPVAAQGKRASAHLSSGKAWHPQCPHSLLSHAGHQLEARSSILSARKNAVCEEKASVNYPEVPSTDAERMRCSGPWKQRLHLAPAGHSWRSCKAASSYALPNGTTLFSPQARCFKLAEFWSLTSFILMNNYCCVCGWTSMVAKCLHNGFQSLILCYCFCFLFPLDHPQAWLGVCTWVQVWNFQMIKITKAVTESAQAWMKQSA